MNDQVKSFRPAAAWSQLVILAIASLDIAIDLYANRSDQRRLFDIGQFLQLEGDFNAYAQRFASSFVLFGLIPLLAARLLGWRPRDFGLAVRGEFLRSPAFWLLLVLMPLMSALGALVPELAAYYPFSHSLVELAPRQPWLLALHGLAYLVLYYLPWELLFRGLLVFPFLPASWRDGFPGRTLPGWRDILANPAVIALACWQTVPTMLIHYPGPFSETVGALPFGLMAAVLVLRFRSILPVLIIHFCCGFALDTVLILGPAF